MKRLAVTSVFLSAKTWAATVGLITITGTVPGLTSITVTPLAGYNTIDLSSTAVDLPVADVRERNNTPLGYNVKLTSQNAGVLKNGTLGSIPYTAKYGTNAVTLSTTPVTVTTQGPQNSVVNVVRQFKISFTGVPHENVMAGAYSDTLTFTITAN
jgi:hypothetical protein